MDQLFDRFPEREDPFDYGTYFSSPIECELVLTNCRTGRAEYRQERQDQETPDVDLCRASCSVPVGTPMVEIDDTPYLDGGLANSISDSQGNGKELEKEYCSAHQKCGLSEKAAPRGTGALSGCLYKISRAFKDAAEKGADVQDRTLAAIEKWEREGRIFVIRPQMKAIGRLESDFRDFWKLSTGTAMSRYAGSMRRCRPLFKSKKQRGENLQS